MHHAEACPVCGGADAQSWPALTAPFIAEYVLDSEVGSCELRQCTHCGLRYFDRRYDDVDMGRLYASYRGEEYFRVRHHHEFWYTKAVNSLTHDPAVIAARQESLVRALSARIAPDGIGKVLDFGGDSGQLLPRNMGQARFVFDISDARPAPGVTKIAAEADLEPAGYDVVVLTGVLEHVSDPVALLGSVARLLTPGRGCLYAEVPWERYSLGLMGSRAGYLDWLRRHERLLHLVDLYSTSIRVKFRFIPPLGFPKLHEHINFFEERSLSRTLAAAGLDVLDCRRGRLAGERADTLLYAVGRAGPPPV